MLIKATRSIKIDSGLNCIAKLASTATKNNDLLDLSFKKITTAKINIPLKSEAEGSAAVVLNHSKFCGIKA